MDGAKHQLGDATRFIDGLGVGIVAFVAGAPLVLGPYFRMLFAEYGSALPELTELVVTRAFEMVCATPGATGVVAFLMVGERATRRAVIVISAALTVVLQVPFWIGVYIPVFSIAGAVK